MDNFKRYLSQHKDGLDVDSPPDHLWQNIQASVQSKPTAGSVYSVLKYAVAASLIIAISAGIWLATHKEKGNTRGVVTKNGQPSRTETIVEQDKIENTRVAKDLPQIEIPKPGARTGQKQARTKSSTLTYDDLAGIDKTYSRLINHKLEQLKTIPVYAESPDYFSRFALQLAQMDRDEEWMKAEIGQHGWNDQMLEGLITIYQQKLNVLKQLQKEINKMNELVIGKEQRTGMKAYYLDL